MKYAVLLAYALMFSFPALAQQPAVVDWSYEAKALGEGEYELKFTAAIKAGWYLYSQHLEEGGPIPTTVQVNEHPKVSVLSEVSESGSAVEGFDEMFGMKIKKYKKQAVFTQRVKIEEGVEAITGYIEFMSCDEEQCLPPREIPFTISFQG
jgi:thiol:disulfide interchange protein DsbD